MIKMFVTNSLLMLIVILLLILGLSFLMPI